MKSKFACAFILTGFSLFLSAQTPKRFQLKSPDGKIVIEVEAGTNLLWTVRHENTAVLQPSPISMTLQNGQELGTNPSIVSSKTTSVHQTIDAYFYKKKHVQDQYNQLALLFKKNYGVLFRAYNDGVAYRFLTTAKDSLVIKKEKVLFNFSADHTSFLPYTRDSRHEKDLFQTSFENLYDEQKLSGIPKDTLAFLPLLVNLDDNKKALLLEADLEDYPGMYLSANPTLPNGLQAVFAPYPLEEKLGGSAGGRNSIVTRRADYMARTAGTRVFPWRAVVISVQDKDLLNNDMVYKLAAPKKLEDISWIKPGKVAWDWWNDWNISQVDFRAGINTPTYRYYIDFAAATGLEYIVLDEGWSKNTDITQLSPDINLQELIDYGKQKGVGVVLWATWYALHNRLEEVFAKYASMGVKGFKIDFLDRDDQKMVASTYEIARVAAKHHLLVDLHGMYKPTGLQRTYPNVIGFEGVRGMENVKWAPADDVPRYDVTLPFIRQVAGPMDYTPGAMRNATKSSFRPVNSMPMSQGTRCHQLAMYVVFEAPLGMLSDNPTAYLREKESTRFIAKIPTTFDETVALDGNVGEYAAVARRKGSQWYVGALTNWTARELTLDFSFLGEGTYETEIFRDGINADRDATDYKREVVTVRKGDRRTIALSNGGGWAAVISRKN